MFNQLIFTYLDCLLEKPSVDNQDEYVAAAAL